MLIDYSIPQTILGLKLKLLLLMIIQYIAWVVLSATHFSSIFGNTTAISINLISGIGLAIFYFFLGIHIFRGKAWAKSALTYVNLVLVAFALVCPLLFKLLSVSGILSPTRYLDTSKVNIATANMRIAKAESILNLHELWSNLVVIFCAALILNMLRKYTLLKLWDNNILGKREHIYSRLSLGNSFILGIFLFYSFYSFLIILPDTPDFIQSIKNLFFGNHIIYYIMILIFCWAMAILLGEHSVVRKERAFILQVKTYFESMGVRTIRHAEAFTLRTQLEKQFWPITHSAVIYKVHRLLDAIESSKHEQLDSLLGRIEEIEFQTIEFSRGFLNTLLWSLPLLGFMGTILGIIDTIAAFSNVLTKGQDSSALIGSLQGLSLAFETTLIGLITALTAGYFLAIILRLDEQNNVALSQLCEDEIISKLTYPTSPSGN